MRNRYLYITLLSILAWHAEAQGFQGTQKLLPEGIAFEITGNQWVGRNTLRLVCQTTDNMSSLMIVEEPDRAENEEIPTTTPFAYFSIIKYELDFQPAPVLTPVTINRMAPSISNAIRIRAPNACISAPLFL